MKHLLLAAGAALTLSGSVQTRTVIYSVDVTNRARPVVAATTILKRYANLQEAECLAVRGVLPTCAQEVLVNRSCPYTTQDLSDAELLCGLKAENDVF